MADLIASGINNLPNPSSDVITSVLEEFVSFMALPGATIKRVIEPQASYKETKPASAKTQRNPYDILFYSLPKKVAMTLSGERSSIAAFVIALLPDMQAKEVMAFMPDRKRQLEETIREMKKNPLSETIKEKIVPILAERLERIYSEG
jgi:hypothetical protein